MSLYSLHLGNGTEIATDDSNDDCSLPVPSPSCFAAAICYDSLLKSAKNESDKKGKISLHF